MPISLSITDGGEVGQEGVVVRVLFLLLVT